jgi:hypothetical protein
MYLIPYLFVIMIVFLVLAVEEYGAIAFVPFAIAWIGMGIWAIFYQIMDS